MFSIFAQYHFKGSIGVDTPLVIFVYAIDAKYHTRAISKGLGELSGGENHNQ